MLYSSAYKKSLFICDCFIFSSYFIFTAYDKIIAFVAVSTGAASNQLTVDLADPEEIRVAHERKHMKKIMAFGKFRIRALCEMITGSMVFPVIWLVNIDEAGRILPDILSVPVSRSAEDLIDQPHIKGPVQIEYLPQFCKRTHEQVIYEFLHLTDRRLVRQSRIKRKNKKSAINRPGMTVLLSSVVREVLKIGIIVLNRLLPDPVRIFSVSVYEPFLNRFTIRQFVYRNMIHYHLLLFYKISVITAESKAATIAIPAVPMIHFCFLSFAVIYGLRSSVPGMIHALVWPTQ